MLFYRPQDGTTLSAMVASEKEGSSKRESWCLSKCCKLLITEQSTLCLVSPRTQRNAGRRSSQSKYNESQG